MIKDSVRDAAAKLGIGAEALVKRLNEMSMSAEKESVRLGATQALVDLMDLQPEKEGRRGFVPVGGRVAGEIAAGEFREVREITEGGQRRIEGRALTSGYEAGPDEEVPKP